MRDYRRATGPLILCAGLVALSFGLVRAEKTAPPAAGWIPLFDGGTLEGWQSDQKDLWLVGEGAIIGRSPGIKDNKFLFSRAEYGDFELRYEVRLRPDDANSGMQIRSERLPDGHARGYQVDVGRGYWGSLHHELGRGTIAPFKREEGSPLDPIKIGEFNRFEVTARGHRITIRVNGVQTVDLEDPEGELTGRLALQIHSGGPMEVQFRNLEIRAIPKAVK